MSIFIEILSQLWMQGFAPVTDPLNQCYEQIADSPRTAVQACLQSKLDRADGVMSQLLMDNEAELKKIAPSVTTQAIALLKKSQDDFLAFRTSE